MSYILADNNPSCYDYDLGLGSRLFAWSQAFYCASKYNYTVVIPEDEWAEQIFLSLPNTIVMTRDDIGKIEWTTLHYHGSHIPNKKYWRIDGMCAIPESFVKTAKDPLWLLKFKSNKLNDFFEHKFDNFTGFHLRRWSGVPPREGKVKDILKSLPTVEIRLKYYEMWKEYNKMRHSKTNTDPPWIYDKTYYSVLDRIKTHIYMSTDLPKDVYCYYKIRYPNIVDMYDYIEEWEDLVSQEYNLDDITTFANATVRTISHDLLDMFCLSKCNFFILSADSQWGQSSVRLNNRKNNIRKSHVIGMPIYATM